MQSYSIRITGKVQGVFFRVSTKEKADELGINGFVRNEPDGSVYIEAEGESDVMQEFLSWCKRGPKNAEVISVINTPIEAKSYKSFEVRRG